MKFFIDSANMDEIRKAKAWGMLDGVTTNPSLIAKEGRDYYEAVREVALEVDGPVSGEVLATDYDGMMREGHELAKIAPNVVVKIPMLPEGMRAVRTLTSEGIRTNVTLVFSASQALVAAKAGASYVSPFVGRLDDISHVGMDVVAEIVQIYENFDYATEVLVASARHPLHVIEAAKLGADVTTMPFKVMEQLFKHPLTDIGLARFLADWEQAKRELAAAATTAGSGR